MENDIIEVQNVLRFMKKHGVPTKRNQAPADMPEPVRDTVYGMLDITYDWDAEEDDPAEIVAAKKRIKEECDNAIKILADWLNTREELVEYTEAEKQQMALKQYYENVKANNKLRKGGTFYIEPVFLVKIGLVTSDRVRAKIGIGEFRLVRESDDINWVCTVVSH